MATDTPAPTEQSGRVVIDAADLWRPIDERAGALRAERRSALFRRRWRAWRIDGIALLPVWALSVAIGEPAGPLLAFALSLSYFFVCESLTGQTLGKRVAGLRVVRLDGGPLNLAAVAARNLLLLVDAAFLCTIGVLAVTFTPHRQRVGDLVAGTVVTVADDHRHVPARQRGRTAILAGYPALWIGAALLVGLLAGRAADGDRYLRVANLTCVTAQRALPQGSALTVAQGHATFTGLERSLSALRPPATRRAGHARLLAAIHAERKLLGRAEHARGDRRTALLAEFSALVGRNARQELADGYPGCA
jgi:uncharacterized RDD family membrane protein YckC